MKALRILLIISVLIFSACAKKREVKKLPDPDIKMMSKTDFTDGSWFSKVTVTKTSLNGGFLFTGIQSEMKVGHFKFSENKLKFLNDVNTIKSTSDSTQSDLINQWDISHFDFKLEESDGKVTNKEVEDSDKSWEEKRFFKVKFDKANISEAGTFPYYVDLASFYECWSPVASELVDESLDIDSDHINFVVSVNYQQNSLCGFDDLRRHLKGDFTFTVDYFYSFRKYEKTNYKALTYASESDPLLKKFGFFQTVREFQDPSTGLLKNVLMANRFDPNKTHTFYFTKDFPQEYKWIYNDSGKGIFAETNKLMQRNGLKARFVIRDNDYGNGKTKEFGDLRYSFIKVIPEMDLGGAPLGYGPSDANPFTGEIVASNLMVWSGYLKFYLERIKESVTHDSEKFEQSSLFKSLKDNLGENVSTWTKSIDQTQGVGIVFDKLVPETTFGYPPYARFTMKDSFTPNDVFKFKNLKFAAENGKDSDLTEFMKDVQLRAEKSVKEQMLETSSRSQVIYPKDQSLAVARDALIKGRSSQEIINTILYRVAIHEFGHNLGLRHNFMGTVDKKNFRPEHSEMIDGKETLIAQKSSSVMDYLALEDEYLLDHTWEPYDEAALAFSYSSGANNQSDKNFFYCTDEHRLTNPLCNHWDHGTSPSEVVMSNIETYERLYKLINFRRDKAYWNTSGYTSRIFNIMWDMKRFLQMWRAGMNSEATQKVMEKMGGFSQDQIEAYKTEISKQNKQANKLAIAFFNSVIAQSAADRDYRDEYEPFSGELKRVGILYDKVYAMLFLMGDDSFLYNPNREMSNVSYLTYRNEPEFRELLDKTVENFLTKRVDMFPWFIGFGRILYAVNATDYNNLDDVSLIEKIKVTTFTSDELKKNFDFRDSDLDTDQVVLETELPNSRDAYYRKGESVGILKINNKFALISKERAPYAYSIVNEVKEAVEFNDSVRQAQLDILDLERLFRLVTQ